MLDHLGMAIFEDSEGVYLSMQSYIEVMATRLELDTAKGRKYSVPMSNDITDMIPCTPSEAKLFMSATGMVGWLSATSRPDFCVRHSRVSQYMAGPTGK